MSAKIRLADHNYGSTGIRLLRLHRDSEPQGAFEVEVDVRLEGNHLPAFRQGDDSQLLSTTELADRVRRVAAKQSGSSLEQLGLALGHHFVESVGPVSRAAVELAERRWLGVLEHDHAFRAVGGERHTARVIVDGGGTRVRSGVLELGLLQTGRPSSEEPPVFGDRLRAVWDYRLTEVDYDEARRTVRDLLVGTFAEHESSSAHRMLWDMGCGVLSAMEAVWRIHLVLPQIPCRPWDLEEVEGASFFVPTLEPAGRIEITLERT